MALNRRCAGSSTQLALTVVPEAGRGWQQGQQGPDADPLAGTLQLEALIECSPALPSPDLSADRSDQIGARAR